MLAEPDSLFGRRGTNSKLSSYRSFADERRSIGPNPAISRIFRSTKASFDILLPKSHLRKIDVGRMNWPRALPRTADELPAQIETCAASATYDASLFQEVDMASGTVKWFNTDKGFGFIQPEDGGQDAFVHISAVERAGLRTLKEGQKVSYELVQDKRSGKVSADNLQAE